MRLAFVLLSTNESGFAENQTNHHAKIQEISTKEVSYRVGIDASIVVLTCPFFSLALPGNCIWYSEPTFLSQITSHLEENNVTASVVEWPASDVPKEVQSVLDAGGYGNVGGTEDVYPELQNKIDSFRRSLGIVERTETGLQNNYWRLKHRFSNRESKKAS